MNDAEARFAAELGRQIGRMDWWNLKAEHTPYEWAVQWTLYNVEPYGERRADLRAAFHTAHIVARQFGRSLEDDEFHELAKSLVSYLKVTEPPEQIVGPAAIRQLLER